MTEPAIAFDLDTLLARLRKAAVSDAPRAAVKDILEDTLQHPEQVANGMPKFAENDVILFEDDTVSIWYCRFMPGQTLPAHDHRMSATIGVFDGAERNDFYENDPNGGIRESSQVIVAAGDVLQIGPSAIHGVGCMGDAPSQGIHVYLGRLTTVARSLFDVESGAVMAFTDENYHRLVRVRPD